MGKEIELSIVVPCYNEEAVIERFYTEVTRMMREKLAGCSYEIVFVDDGSRDKTREIIEKLSADDSRIQYVSFSRNFGKESAMYAGLEYAEGKYTVMIDADLQHPPKYIADMFALMETGEYDMVATRRKSRGNEPKLRSLCSEMFYKIMNKISGINMGNNALDYRMFNQTAKNAILNMTEYNRFSKGIFEWIGFRTYWLEINIDERAGGQSKWSFRKLAAYSMEGCIAFSTLPLSIASFIGFLFCLIAVIMIIVMLIEALVYGNTGSGYATIICLIMLVSGIQLFCQGIMGKYIAKDYLENKKRPIYLTQAASKKKSKGCDENAGN